MFKYYSSRQSQQFNNYLHATGANVVEIPYMENRVLSFMNHISSVTSQNKFPFGNVNTPITDIAYESLLHIYAVERQFAENMSRTMMQTISKWYIAKFPPGTEHVGLTGIDFRICENLNYRLLMLNERSRQLMCNIITPSIFKMNYVTLFAEMCLIIRKLLALYRILKMRSMQQYECKIVQNGLERSWATMFALADLENKSVFKMNVRPSDINMLMPDAFFDYYHSYYNDPKNAGAQYAIWEKRLMSGEFMTNYNPFVFITQTKITIKPISMASQKAPKRTRDQYENASFDVEQFEKDVQQYIDENKEEDDGCCSGCSQCNDDSDYDSDDYDSDDDDSDSEDDAHDNIVEDSSHETK